MMSIKCNQTSTFLIGNDPIENVDNFCNIESGITPGSGSEEGVNSHMHYAGTVKHELRKVLRAIF